MSSRVPRKQRNLKAAASASAAAGVETNSSNCPESDVISQASNYELFGYLKTDASYTSGEVVDIASISDQEKQVTGKNSSGVTINLKGGVGPSKNTDTDIGFDLIDNFILAGISPNAAHYNLYRIGNIGGTSGAPAARRGPGLTGTISPANALYGVNGPQAAYIPQLALTGSGGEYVFFLPSSITGAGGSNMPPGYSASFAVTIAGAVAPGESIQVYTASAAGYGATGSAFTYSGSYCSTPNFATSSIFIRTASLPVYPGADTGGQAAKSGIVIIYTASFTIDGTKENTPYAGPVMTITPSNVHANK